MNIEIKGRMPFKCPLPNARILGSCFHPPINHRLIPLADTNVILHVENYKFNVHYQFIVTATFFFFGPFREEQGSIYFLSLTLPAYIDGYDPSLQCSRQPNRIVTKCIFYVNSPDYCNIILW